LILRACPLYSSQTSRLPESDEKEAAPFRSTKQHGERLIKTLLKKIVHNKNLLLRRDGRSASDKPDFAGIAESIGVFPEILTTQASFLQ